MSGDSRYASMTDRELKHWVEVLSARFRRASPAARDVIADEARDLRDELLRRLDDGDGPDPDAVREPRRPRPGSGSAEATTSPDER